jgi:hypothetical protein
MMVITPEGLMMVNNYTASTVIETVEDLPGGTQHPCQTRNQLKTKHIAVKAGVPPVYFNQQ